MYSTNGAHHYFGIHSFRYEGTKDWNNIPEYLKDTNEVGDFKQLIKQSKDEL